MQNMDATAEMKQSENSEAEENSAQQQESANLNDLQKDVPIANAELPEASADVIQNKDNVVSDGKAEANPKHEKNEVKKDKYNAKQENNAPRSQYRRGRNRDDTEDIRNYVSRPSGNATLFDFITTQVPIAAHQSGSSSVPKDEFGQMRTSDVPQDPPHGNYYGGRGRGDGGGRGRGNRGGGRGGRPSYNNCENPQQQQYQYQPSSFPVFFQPPPPGYVHPMPQHIRNPNPVDIEPGKHVLAPFTDNNGTAMTAIKALRDDGWRIDEIKLQETLGETFNEKLAKDELKKVLSNLDIKEFSETFLSEGISNKSLRGPVIVQLSKWENVSYPKINEHVQNNGVCLLIVTDGAKPTKAMTTEPLANISGETPYGSKILLSGDLKLENGILQLNPKNCKFIGGTVDKLVEKWKTERYSSKQDARNTSDAPKWTSLTAKGTVPSKNEKDNFKSMAATTETKQSENSEFDAARQQEIANLSELRKNVHIASVKLPDVIHKKDNVVADGKDEDNSKQERNEVKKDKYDSKPKQENNAPRSNFRKGRNRDDTEDIRNYISRPSGNATLFDMISTQVPIAVQQSGNSFTPRDEFAQMRISEVHKDQGNNYRNGSGSSSRGGEGSRGRGNVRGRGRGDGGSRGRGDFGGRGRGDGGGRGRGYRAGGRGGNASYNNYENPQHQQQYHYQPSAYPSFNQPTAQDFPPMPQHIRNPNPSTIDSSRQASAPFPDNNIRKTFYNTSRRR